MEQRYRALELTTTRLEKPEKKDHSEHVKKFGIHVFKKNVMAKMLPKNIYQNVKEAMEGRGKIKEGHANKIAQAMKDWAMKLRQWSSIKTV